MNNSFLQHIESFVGKGRATISADDYGIIEIVKTTIKSGVSASFYLSPEQIQAIRDWYWTPERIKTSKIEPVSPEEKARIESELGLENIGSFRCSQLQCECGDTYGAFEFLQQGIREHGLDAVGAIFALKNSAFLRVNPSFVLICPSCNEVLRDGGIEYEGDTYAGCSYQEPE